MHARVSVTVRACVSAPVRLKSVRECRCVHACTRARVPARARAIGRARGSCCRTSPSSAGTCRSAAAWETRNHAAQNTHSANRQRVVCRSALSQRTDAAHAPQRTDAAHAPHAPQRSALLQRTQVLSQPRRRRVPVDAVERSAPMALCRACLPDYILYTVLCRVVLRIVNYPPAGSMIRTAHSD